VFGAGGGTSSYREVEETDVILLWGSNARETHPIFFHHVLKGVRPRREALRDRSARTTSAEWADGWLRSRRQRHRARQRRRPRDPRRRPREPRVHRARTTGFDAYREHVSRSTLERASPRHRRAGRRDPRMAHAYARADRAMICWTLGITEHHNAVDNVLSLINLALLTGHVGRWGSGLNPLRGQNNVQGGGDMGALPHKLPASRTSRTPIARGRSSARGAHDPAQEGLAPDRDVRRHGPRRAARALRDRREPRAERGRRQHAMRCSRASTTSSCRTSSSRRPPSWPTWCSPPARASRVRGHGHQQRAARAARAPRGRAARRGARDDIEIIAELSRASATRPGRPTPGGAVGRAARAVPCTRGMSYARLESSAASSGRAPTRPPRLAVPARPAVGRARARARARRSRWCCTTRPPVEAHRRRVPAAAHHRPPARLVQHRRAVGQLRARRCAAARRSICPGRRRAHGVSDGEVGARRRGAAR
jgi:hypothetical protein